jgi:hypothetical protein
MELFQSVLRAPGDFVVQENVFSLLIFENNQSLTYDFLCG